MGFIMYVCRGKMYNNGIRPEGEKWKYTAVRQYNLKGNHDKLTMDTINPKE